MMELMTISYRSRARLRDPQKEVASILAESLARNARLAITGLLIFDGVFFVQTLEGPAEDTGSVFASIIEDSRHEDIVPFAVRDIERRVFPDWQMKLIGPEAATRLVPDMADFDFSDRRLAEIHQGARKIAA